MTAAEIALAACLAFGNRAGSGFLGDIVKHAGLQAIHADGSVTLRMEVSDRSETDEAGSKTYRTVFRDACHPFEATRFVKEWKDCGVVETWYELRHDEPGAVKLLKADSFAHGFDTAADPVSVLSLSGSWGSEANIVVSPVGNGQIVELSSKSGTRDAWEANAAMMALFGDGVDEERGKALGVALEWTGTTCRRIRRSWDGKRTEIFAGVDMTSGPYTLDPGVVFRTPKAVLVWSDRGRGEVSRRYHRWARRHLMPHGADLRPVLLNSWEGSYFGFTEQTLIDMMDGVKEMGGEMFVLDDGWFGCGEYARDSRNKDSAGLGDWRVNPEKLPNGLGRLSDEAAKRGLKFGFWVEPEMVNTKSRLADARPEWLLKDGKRPLLLGRGGTQTVLDLANPDVRDNLFSQLDAVFSSVPSLAYVKWDCNQNLSNPGSASLAADRQPNLWYDYTAGLYELLGRLRSKYPEVAIQACASGGGHMDFGFLRYANEFWTSDNTDPYRRVFIQWGASQFYPASAMACHVTASPNHQTKRETPLKYRFDVAMTGRLGFELHPKDLSPEEIAFAKAAVADYKRIRPVVQRGDLYRLVSPYERPLASLMYADEEKSHAVLFALGLDAEGERTETIALRGLDPGAEYSVREINRGDRVHADLPSAPIPAGELTGRGLTVTLRGRYDSAVFEIAASPDGMLPAQ